MFRAKQLSKLLTNFPAKAHCSSKYLLETQSFNLSKTLVTSRFFSSKKNDNSKVGSNKNDESENPETPDNVKLKECKAIDINPYYPSRPLDHEGKVPSVEECSARNMMSDSPQPKCSYDEYDKKYRKTYRNVLLWGLLFTAVTLGAVYFTGFLNDFKDKKKSKSKKKVFKHPATSGDIPKNVPYLLIGGGTASFSAFRAIKSSEPTAKVLVVSEEAYYPYMRPPLSKEIWFNEDKDSVKKLIFKQWNGSERSLFYEPDDFYIECKDLMDAENGGVAVARGWKITHLDVLEKKAYLDDGAVIQYGKCLVATGAKTKKMAVFESAAQSDEVVASRIKYYRDIKDFEQVEKLYEKSKAIAVVGGGFLGSELACALARRDKQNTKEIIQIFRESGNMGKVLPEYLSFWTTDKVNAEGVNVKTNTEVVSVRSNGKELILKLTDGSNLKVDNVIIAVGVEPNTDFAVKSDLEVDPDYGGYLVNTELQARTNLYIAGDCSCFYDPLLGRRRIEHHDHAVVSGRLAGENMTGAAKPYVHQSMFWSDLGPDVGYEAIGIVDSTLPTVGVFAKATYKDNPQAVVTATDEGDRSKTEEVPKECYKHLTEQQAAELRELRRKDSKPKEKEGEDFGKGVIFYLRDDVVVGIVLWNVFNRMSIARQVLKAQNKYDDLNEVAKLFNIHEE